MQITRDEFVGWLINPVTEEFRRVKKERADKLAHLLAAGTCLRDEVAYAKACGQYEEIQDTLEITYDDMLPKENIN